MPPALLGFDLLGQANLVRGTKTVVSLYHHLMHFTDSNTGCVMQKSGRVC
jgi:hypothetical protein